MARLLNFTVLFFVAFISSSVSGNDGPLVDGFVDPPREARPSAYYLLLNGYCNRDYIGTELRQLHDVGIRGLCVFDMGGRGSKETLPPDGPEFMSDEWIDNFSQIVHKAGELDMDVQLAVSSSWDMGASWVKPKDASKALYHCSVRKSGPGRMDEVLDFPKIAAIAPKDSAGNALFYSEVAVLAIPEDGRRLAHEFVFKMPASNESAIDHVVLFNTISDDAGRHGTMNLFSKDFSVSVSQTGTEEESFQEVVRDSLEAHTRGQRFDFAAVRAGYVRLRIYNGHNKRFDGVQLGEFEVYSVQGRNVAGGHEVDRMRDAAQLVRFSSQSGNSGKWTADNINDGVKSGASGSWASAGDAPSLVESADKIIDLTNRLNKDGRLKWDIPAGDWTIVRFICANTGERLKVPSPQSNGLATDHFSSGATDRYIRYLTDRLKEQFGDLKATSLKQLYLPSYEVRGSVWTEDLLERFKEYRGYDAKKYLAALTGYVVRSREVTDRFVYDFDKTLGELLVDAYYRTASKSARLVGLGIEAESGGPGPPVHQVPVDALNALGAIDEMRGEFWPWRMEMGPLWVVKETACAAHVYGRRRVHMEAFTGFRHWQDGPFELKPSADRAFCEGMNHVVWHTSSHQPPEAGKPGWVYGAGTHLTPNLAWWSKAGAFVDYLSRCSFMLQQGLFVADVCYYYGDQGYNFVGPKHQDRSPGFGYDYDVANPEVVLKRMNVRDGRITLPDGMKYEVLVLPQREDIDLAVLRKVAAMVKAGAAVIGPKPVRSNGLGNYVRHDLEVKRLAEMVWGDCDGKNVYEHSYGKGKVIWGRSVSEVLRNSGLGVDFQYTAANGDADLDYIHRRTDQADIYFVSNKNSQSEKVKACFRVFGKAPQLWHPDTGKIRKQIRYEQTPEGVIVPLEFAPSGSVFVVFPRPPDKGQQVALSDEEVLRTVELSGAWKVNFSAQWGAPKSVTFEELKSWTQHAEEGVRYYSGIGRYEKDFDVDGNWLREGVKLWLDAGRLWSVGEVFVNGKPMGVVWKPPYRVEITEAVRSGTNLLEIEVANTWANRLVGDAHSPEEKRFCRTNITSSGTQRKLWKDIELRESGLFGPVKVVITDSSERSR